MQRIAGMTVTVRADGVPEAIFNGQRDRVVEAIKAEMARQKLAMNAEMDIMREELTGEIAIERDRADINLKARCRLLGDRLDGLKESLTGRRSPAARARRALENAWAMIWAIGKCWVEIGETLGFWERIEGDEEDENHERAACAFARQRAQKR